MKRSKRAGGRADDATRSGRRNRPRLQAERQAPSSALERESHERELRDAFGEDAATLLYDPPVSQPETFQPPQWQPPASQPPRAQLPRAQPAQRAWTTPPPSQPPRAQPAWPTPPSSRPPRSELPQSEPRSHPPRSSAPPGRKSARVSHVRSVLRTYPSFRPHITARTLQVTVVVCAALMGAAAATWVMHEREARVLEAAPVPAARESKLEPALAPPSAAESTPPARVPARPAPAAPAAHPAAPDDAPGEAPTEAVREAELEASAAPHAEAGQPARKAVRKAARRPARGSARAKRSGPSPIAPPAQTATEPVRARAPVAVPAKPPSRATGVLRINSRPWSRVYIDGRLVGHTPQTGITLEAGPHIVTLISPDFGLKRTFTVRLRGGQTLTRIVDLQ